MAVHKATKRLHLLTNPKRPDVVMGMTDASDPEPTPVIPTPLTDSYRNHPRPRRRLSGVVDNVTMNEDRHQTRIFRDPRDPDVVVVLAEGWIPTVIPVIHTPLCDAYWAHPSNTGAPRAA
jgi:hypothetical protein